jgi:capsular polysaccharide biosynthesis protein
MLTDLRDYLALARRWWWLILLPPLVVLAFGLATYRPPAGGYSAAMRYTASQPAGLAATTGYDPNYYRWLTSEYIVTGLRDWVRTGAFATAVSAELAARGTEIPAGALNAALASDNARSVLVVYLTWPDAAQAAAILEAVTAVLQAQNAAVFPQLGGLAAEVVPLDAPAPGPVAPSLRAQLDLPLKAGLALAVGLGLALAAHFLDPFVRERRDLEALGLTVVGEIPKK